MVGVTFHSGPSEIQRIELCCCQLVEQLFLHGHRVLLHTSGPEQLQRLNLLLWEFDADSFVPHAPLGEVGEAPPAVMLSADDSAADEALAGAPFGALAIAPGARIPPTLRQDSAAKSTAAGPDGSLGQIHYMVLKNGGAEQKAAREDFLSLQQLTGNAPRHRAFS